MTQRILTMAQAISEAIGMEMQRDPRVFAMGEDIGTYGGIFSATSGLLERFGPQRMRDTPISETAFIGAATGAAAAGMRPIAELMFVDFFGVCMDQIYNHLAKNIYMSGGALKLPVVLTTAIGGGYGDAAQHSQCAQGGAGGQRPVGRGHRGGDHRPAHARATGQPDRAALGGEDRAPAGGGRGLPELRPHGRDGRRRGRASGRIRTQGAAAPARRAGVPIPYSRPLEQWVVPSVERIAAACREVVEARLKVAA